MKWSAKHLKVNTFEKKLECTPSPSNTSISSIPSCDISDPEKSEDDSFVVHRDKRRQLDHSKIRIFSRPFHLCPSSLLPVYNTKFSLDHDYLNDTCGSTAKQIGVLYLYLNHINTGRSTSIWHPIQKFAVQAIQRNLSLMNGVPCFNSSFIPQNERAKLQDASIRATSHLDSICAAMVFQLMNQNTMQQHMKFMEEHKDCILSKMQLMQAYIKWVRFSVSQINTCLEASNTTLLDITNQIVAYGKSNESSCILRKIMEQYEDSNTVFGYRSFVAQMREIFMVWSYTMLLFFAWYITNSLIVQASDSPRKPLSPSLSPSVYDGMWQYNAERSKYAMRENDVAPSVLGYFQWLMMGFAFKQTLQNNVLHVCNVNSLLLWNAPNDATSF